MFVDQERRLLSPDDCYFIPSGRRHGWKTFDVPAKVLDVSSKAAAGTET
jgi:mannose-6-phosphate isomerase-like protein (cupin superfamily)